VHKVKGKQFGEVIARVATKTIREIVSPLDRITGKLKEGAEPPA
jgi:hypothetical protein